MNKLLRNLSIRVKLGLIILLVNLVILLLVSGALLTNERIRLEQGLKNDMMLLAEIVGANSSVGLIFDDADTVEETLSSLKAKSNITEAVVFNETGKFFAGYASSSIEQSNAHNINLEARIAEVNNQLSDNNESFVDMPDVFLMLENIAQVFHKVVIEDRFVGIIFIESDLKEFNQRLFVYGMTMFGVLVVALLIAIFLAHRLQALFTTPVYNLLNTMSTVSDAQNYSLRAEKTNNDEFGQLIDEFNTMLGKVQERDHEIQTLNALLQVENQRMGSELDIARQLQVLVLPKKEETQAIAGLDIATFMEPASEVGGDYYDVLQYENRIILGIGDVTGHGLESGVLMLMAQTAIRTLTNTNISDPKAFFSALNKTLYGNISRMGVEKSMTLSILNYCDGDLAIMGQHEDILFINQAGTIERIDTDSLGFMVGLLDDIDKFLNERTLRLLPGEGIILHTDGITEAHNTEDEVYGIERLCKLVETCWDAPAKHIQQKIIDDVYSHTGERPLIDDITLLVIKRAIKT